MNFNISIDEGTMQHRNRLTARIMSLMIGLLLVTGAAMAGVPGAPQHMAAGIHGLPGYQGALLQWDRVGDATGYNIYMSSDGGNTYSRLDQVRDSANQRIVQYFSRVLPNGYYVFYATAFNDEGEGPASHYPTLTLDGIGIRFQNSWSADSTYIGVNLERGFQAEASNNGAIVYSLVGAPSGMAIDASTGVVTWTPTQAGYFNVEVVATLASNSRVSARTSYTVIVQYRPSDFCATISGTIRMDNGDPVGGGYLRATIMYVDGTSMAFAAQINNGAFSLAVPAGTFVLEVTGEFKSEYYENATSIRDAERITLGCNESRSVAFSVAPQPRRISDSVMGRVTDATTGAAVPYARVQFFRADDGSIAAEAQTNLSGGYLVALPQDSLFYALASDPSGRHASVYYGGSTTAAGATRFNPLRDSAHIDFQLPQKEYYFNVMEGQLVDTSGTGLFGHIVASRIGDNGEPGEMVETWARQGSFYLSNLPPGDYVVWGEAGDSVHVPGYHVAGGVAAMTWTNGTRVSVGASDSIFGVEIRLVFMEGHGGTSRLRGTILSNGGTLRKKDGAGILGLSPVAGATVFALDAQNDVAGYSGTDAQGRFEISKLETGTYTVIVDRVGFKPFFGSATVTEGETTLDLQLESPSSSAPRDAAAVAAVGIFPNPADRSTTIRFNGVAGLSSVSLADLRGEQVLSRNITTVDGTNSITVETASLPAGIYLLRIGSAGPSTATIVTVTH